MNVYHLLGSVTKSLVCGCKATKVNVMGGMGFPGLGM